MADINVRLGIDYNPRGMQQFIVETREGETAAEALARAERDGAIATEENAQAHEKTANGFASMNSQARGLRVGMAGLLADMALMTLATGETLPQGLREGAQGLQTVIDLAIAGNFIFPGLGAVIGGVAGALLAFGAAALQVDPDIADMNKSLDALAQKDKTAETLAKIMGWTQLDADAALLAAKNNTELAKALDAVVKDREPPNWIQALLSSANMIERNPLLLLMTGGVMEAGKATAIGEEMYRRFKQGEDDLKLAEELRQDQAKKNYQDLQKKAEDYYSEIGTLGEQRVANEASMNARLLEYAKQLTQARINEENQIAQNIAAEAVAEERAQRTLNDNLLKIDREYQDREDSLAYDHQRRLDQIAYDEAHQRQQAADEQRQQYQQLQDRLADIARSTAESIAQLDFNTHESLMSAKTQREREDILRRALFERGQLEQNANDQRSDAERRYAEERDLAERKKVLDQQTYEHQIQLEDENYRHQREMNQRTYDEKVADAKQANAEQTADLQANLKTQNEAIVARYNQEVANINIARSAFVTAEGLKQQALQKTIDLLRQEAQFLLGPVHAADYGIPNQQGGVVPIPAPPLAHTGINNSIIIPGSGGGNSQTKEGSTQIVNVNANGSLVPILHDVFRQLMQSHSFRDGVKIVMNDEMNR